MTQLYVKLLSKFYSASAVRLLAVVHGVDVAGVSDDTGGTDEIVSRCVVAWAPLSSPQYLAAFASQVRLVVCAVLGQCTLKHTCDVVTWPRTLTHTCAVCRDGAVPSYTLVGCAVIGQCALAHVCGVSSDRAACPRTHLRCVQRQGNSLTHTYGVCSDRAVCPHTRLRCVQ